MTVWHRRRALLRGDCWHRWVCRHGYAASECSSGPYRCADCDVLYAEGGGR